MGLVLVGKFTYVNPDAVQSVWVERYEHSTYGHGASVYIVLRGRHDAVEVRSQKPGNTRWTDDELTAYLMSVVDTLYPIEEPPPPPATLKFYDEGGEVTTKDVRGHVVARYTSDGVRIGNHPEPLPPPASVNAWYTPDDGRVDSREDET